MDITLLEIPFEYEGEKKEHIYTDMKGNETKIGDLIAYPGDSSDPVYAKIDTMWIDIWSQELPERALIKFGNKDGHAGMVVKLGESLKMK